jgi:hypothetical protein
MYGEAFFQRLWHSAGIQFAVLVVIASALYRGQPKVGASHADLISFYDGHSTRILIATVVVGLAFLNLMWFGAALRTALHDAGQGGWGAAATASSTATAAVLFGARPARLRAGQRRPPSPPRSELTSTGRRLT